MRVLDVNNEIVHAPACGRHFKFSVFKEPVFRGALSIERPNVAQLYFPALPERSPAILKKVVPADLER